jgi:hypothetical protein
MCNKHSDPNYSHDVALEPIAADLYVDLKIVLRNSRDWHRREQRLTKLKMHPVVEAVIKLYRPMNWHLLVLEWPHLADDGKRLSYTRDERAGEADRQLVTTPGKYLRRHFPTLADDVIRDLVLQHTHGDFEFIITRDIHEIVSFKQHGPKSCMTFKRGSFEDHPYRVYDPKYGWGLAVHRAKSDGFIFGTALVWEGDGDDNDERIFVRSYFAPDREYDGYSHADQRLEAWLKDVGYEHRSSWYEGTKLARVVNTDGDTLMPYLDGNNQQVDVHGSYLTIEDRGEYCATDTDGLLENDRAICACCDERCHEDHVQYVDDYGDVCDGCIERHFYWSEAGEEYVHADYAIETVDGGYIHHYRLGRYNYTMVTSGTHEDLAAPDDETIVDAYGNTWHQDDEDDLVTLHSDSKYGDEVVHNEAPDLICTVDGDYFDRADIGSVVFEITDGPSKGEYVALNGDSKIWQHFDSLWLLSEYNEHLENQRVNADAEQE